MNDMSRNNSFDDSFEDLTDDTVLENEDLFEKVAPSDLDQESVDNNVDESILSEDINNFNHLSQSEDTDSICKEEQQTPDSTSSDIDVIYEDYNDSSDEELSTASLCSSSVVSQDSNLSYLRDQYLLHQNLNQEFLNEDLSETSSLNYRELDRELELNGGPRAYVHTPNIGLNGKLNLILILSVFTVVGLGIGNYIGWSNHWEHQKQLSLGQILKLKQLQDELVVCMQSQANKSEKNLFKEFSFLFLGNELPIRNLKKYSIDFTSNEINRIKVLTENSKTSLKSLKINVGKVDTTEELNILLNELSKLSKLKNLKIAFNGDNSSAEINNSSVEYFRRIAENCPQISSLDLQLSTNSSEVNHNIYNTLNAFKNLKKLRISLITTDKSQPFLLTSKMLNNCINLTHLTINGSVLLNDEFFNSIDINLPKLQHLSLDSMDITERTVESLSKLCSNLKSIDIRSQSMASISDSLVMEVIKNCPKLKYFNLNNKQMSVNLKGKELKKMRKNTKNIGRQATDRRKGWFYGRQATGRRKGWFYGRQEL